MSAHVLLNLLNELGKSDKMRGLPIKLFLDKALSQMFHHQKQYVCVEQPG